MMVHYLRDITYPMYLLLFFISPLIVLSQNIKTDSLVLLLKESNLSKRNEVILLADIAFYHTNIDSSLIYANQSLQLAKKIKEPLLQAEAIEIISLREGKLGNAIASLKATLKALQIYETLGLNERQAASYTQLANNYMNNENYKSAIFFLKKARYIYEKNDGLGNLTSTIHNLGEAYRLAHHLDSAKITFEQTLKLNDVLNNIFIESYTLGNLGMVYNTENNLSMAKIHLNNAIHILKRLEDPYSISIYLAELGNVYQKEGDLKIAEEKFLEAMTMAKEARFKEQIRDFSEKLTLLYEVQGDYPKALQYQKLFQAYQDSLVNKENIQQIEQLKAGYEINKRESKISLLNTLNTNQKYLLLILGSGVLAALSILYLLSCNNKKVRKANTNLHQQKEIISKSEQEKSLLLQELNHRVKNNLQMISSLLNLQSHELTGHPAKEALLAGKERVEALSLVHRKLYQEGVETRIVLKEYIKELVLGLFHGYNAKFKPEFKIASASIPIDTAIPLALIMNELVVNALKYAYKGIEKPRLIVKLILLDTTLNIQVIDNGIGFILDENKKNNSFGLKLITSLMSQLEGTLNKTKTKGTHWEIELKNIPKQNTSILPIPKKEELQTNTFHRFRQRKHKTKEILYN